MMNPGQNPRLTGYRQRHQEKQQATQRQFKASMLNNPALRKQSSEGGSNQLQATATTMGEQRQVGVGVRSSAKKSDTASKGPYNALPARTRSASST